MKFVVLTRFFEKDPQKAEKALSKLRDFCDGALSSGAEKIFVAVRSEVDKSGVFDARWDERVAVFGVTPWGDCVLPLTALLLKAKPYASDCNFLFASVKTRFNARHVSVLARYLAEGTEDGDAEKTLVAGAVLPGHNFREGMHDYAGGLEVPYFTFALVNPRLLLRCGGIPILGDGSPKMPENGGMEEVITIASAQTFAGACGTPCRAYLVVVPGITLKFSEDRLAEHEKKMATKAARAHAQMSWAQLANPQVRHVIHERDTR